MNTTNDPFTHQTLFKLLNEGGKPANGGTGVWNLPTNNEPGDWMPPIIGDLVPCERGYHLWRLADLLIWAAPALYVAEYRGKMIDAGDKLVVRQVRLLSRVETWTDANLRLFAADCAERVLPLYERWFPNEYRPRVAIEAARAFARGQISAARLDSAWEAARVTAKIADLTFASGEVEGIARFACAAASDAARGAAWPIVSEAANGAAHAAARARGWTGAKDGWGAEHQWQQERLLAYLSGNVVPLSPPCYRAGQTMTEEEPMRGTLGALIAALRKEDPSLVVSPGLTYPHSYRGFYHDLAFEPTESATVAEVLDLARGAVGRTFGGYKGGDFTMSEYTEVWLSEYGDASGQSIGEEFIRLWLENAHLKKLQPVSRQAED